MERIIIFSQVFSHYYSCGCFWCERVHETDQVKLVCSVLTLEEDRSGLQFHSL